LKVLVTTWRNSIGDIAIFGMAKWSPSRNVGQDKERNAVQTIALTFIWTIWLLNVVFMVIVLLNFVIAEVSQTYERVKSSG